jgi:hypothetical protein
MFARAAIAAEQSLTKSPTELDMLGRQASAHLSMAEKHYEKCGNHFKSAAMCLFEVKQAGIIGGAFETFLKLHDIARSTAYRVLQEYAEPEKKEQRQAVARQREAAMRQSSSPTCGTPLSIKDLPQGGPLTSDEHPKRLAAALLKVRHHMTRENQQRVVQFIQSIHHQFT